MPFGVSRYSACCFVIFSAASIREPRNNSPTDAPVTTAPISLRRDLSSFMKVFLLTLPARTDHLRHSNYLPKDRHAARVVRSSRPVVTPTYARSPARRSPWLARGGEARGFARSRQAPSRLPPLAPGRC